MPYESTAADLVLHGVRVLGFPTAERVAGRYDLDLSLTTEMLLDYEAQGWTRHLSFGDFAGWSLTEAGKTENETRLAAELDRADARDVVDGLHSEFLPLNERLGVACTDWQLRPLPSDSMAINDHTDLKWDTRVLHELTELGAAFGDLCELISRHLTRFSGYADRYSAALTLAQSGDTRWIDGPDRDSCHLVWIQFHEDLLATLGIQRGQT